MKKSDFVGYKQMVIKVCKATQLCPNPPPGFRRDWIVKAFNRSDLNLNHATVWYPKKYRGMTLNRIYKKGFEGNGYPIIIGKWK
jgi:hypothetical protein